MMSIFLHSIYLGIRLAFGGMLVIIGIDDENILSKISNSTQILSIKRLMMKRAPKAILMKGSEIMFNYTCNIYLNKCKSSSFVFLVKYNMFWEKVNECAVSIDFGQRFLQGDFEASFNGARCTASTDWYIQGR